ncbi:MAG: biotin carboxylase N-terminal domain-containing protein [Bacteroidota bacterium]
METNKPVYTRISTILIANRGEIASRIIRTCKKMGIRTVVLYTPADKDLPYVREGDMAINLGQNEPAASYLDQEKIFEAAQKTGADAIHPAYGFLSENADFANRCKEEGLIFIGPSPEAIHAMGSKSEAKSLMRLHNVPVVPGFQGSDQRVETLIEEAQKIGFPVLLKAAAGGGGKGMRRVDQVEDLPSAIQAAKGEAARSFGHDELILEKYVASGRHIEIQIFGDKHGNAIHLFERECSIQRRFQKVVEESPSPIMSPELRDKMGEAAVKAAKALKYENAGTVEFIYDEQSGEFYFLEVNTRLQVEHPVTEEVTGLDLVKMQIEVAEGKPIMEQPSQDLLRGYAIECRLYAENPKEDFLPVTGKIHRFEWPEMEGLRMESAVKSGSEVSIFYDPMIAKLIIWAEDRSTAHRKMRYLLQHMRCLGMQTNQDFLLWLLSHPDVNQGKYDTHFIQKEYTPGSETGAKDIRLYVAAASLHGWSKRNSSRKLLPSLQTGWRNNWYQDQMESFEFEGEKIALGYTDKGDSFQFLFEGAYQELHLLESGEDEIRFEWDDTQYRFQLAQEGDRYFLHNENMGSVELRKLPRFPDSSSEAVAGEYTSPMPSQIIRICVEAGQTVQKGDALIILSSMKMENTLAAQEAGTVEEIYVQEGQNIESDVRLIKINPEA